MIMPFFRLVAIYVIVIIGVVAFFKRDQLMQMSTATFGWPAIETSVGQTEQMSAQTDPVAAEKQAAAQAAQQAKVQPASSAPQAALITAPITAPITAKADPQAIQMPVADPVDQPANAPTIPSQPTAQTKAPDTNPDTQSRLLAARQAYWQGDLARAQALYAALAKDAPGNPDVIGEYGNILFAQKRFDAAGEAYLATGRLLVKNGQRQQIQPLIGVLQNIAPQKAATLRALISN